MGLTSQNRDADYTPWPAPGFDEEYPDFPGKAGEYLQWIDRELLPALRERWPISDQPEDVGILGFSLGGLLASYAPFVSLSFGYAMSLSGSNWYEGLIPFFAAHDPLTPCRFFLSYGRARVQASSRCKRMPPNAPKPPLLPCAAAWGKPL